jgi:hypothetical protein
MTYSCFWDVNEDNADDKLSHSVSLAFSDPTTFEAAELEETSESGSWIGFDDDDDGEGPSLQAIMNAMIKKDAEEKEMEEANNADGDESEDEKETAESAKRGPSFFSKMMAPLEDEGMSTRNYERASRRRGIENLLEQINNTDRYVEARQRSFMVGRHSSRRISFSDEESENKPVCQRSFMEPSRHRTSMEDEPTRQRSFMESKSVRNLIKRNSLVDELQDGARQMSFRETKSERKQTRQTSFRETAAEVRPARRQTSFRETKSERRPARQTSFRETAADVKPVKQRSFFEIRDEVVHVPVKQRSFFHVKYEGSEPNMPVKQRNLFQTKAERNTVHPSSSFDEPKAPVKQRSSFDIKSEVREPKMPLKQRSFFQTKAEVHAAHESSFHEPKTPVKQRSFMCSARDFAKVAFEGISDELDAPGQERRRSDDAPEHRSRRSNRSGGDSSSHRESMSRRNTSYV